MKFVQWALAVIGIVALSLLAVGYFLPSKFSVQRSVVIDAPPKKIYDYVVEPRQWAKWSAWSRRDPDMKVTYFGPPFGMGAKWSWVSKTEGTGTMEFVRVDPDRSIEYALSIPEFGMRSMGTFRLEPDGNATRVTWTNSGDIGDNPLKRYLLLVMDRMVGPDFEAGLANLKALAEQP